MSAIFSHINILAIFIIALIALLIAIKGPNGQMKGALLFFLVCVLDYLFIENIPSGTIRWIMLFGPFLLPFSFWVLSKTMFTDEGLKWKVIVLSGLLVLVVFYSAYLFNLKSDYVLRSFLGVATRSVSLVFVILAIYEAQKQRNVDLIEKRRKLRSILTYFVGGLVILTLLVELGMQDVEQEIPRILQRTAIIFFSGYFLISNVVFKTDFLSVRSKKTGITHPELVDKILEEVSQKALFRKETLTIGQLADQIKEQEYLVRQAINQQLGYRNFTDFINSFRIEEARSILLDPNERKMTVLEIAYKTGFNSIGPFNRAFKSVTGLTPTEYRQESFKKS